MHCFTMLIVAIVKWYFGAGCISTLIFFCTGGGWLGGSGGDGFGVVAAGD